MNDTRNKKDKNQHIQVFVRVRPINSAERASKSPVVVDVQSNKEIVVRERPQDKLTKKFTFDRVFGPSSKQIDVYQAVVNPLLEEVLAGYNCTVFAYGQTGTGKTFTMEGSCNDPAVHWQADSPAGIIPRALSHLFDELRILGSQEYTVRVSFLELYNEELFDLLSPNDDASKIRIYEDANRKGAIIIHGLEEVTVHNKNEVYKILEKGSEKRQTAATLMNAQSSRSHTVFSITVHIKENTVDGEELLKTGKLNLVDLAGSENVGRSGAVDRRAREAGNINQSLLTLGRVITALVERAPHIPYRESKLTRLLQESLGGRTKTSIIATISPACINIEESLSTLDYAHRAKNITNRPEINQKLSKKALLKEYTEEIERLRRDLLATRERNGVYLAQENYNEMQNLIEIQTKEIEEKINHIKALEETMTNKEKLFNDLQLEFETTSNTLCLTQEKLECTKNVLKTTKCKLNETTYDRDLQKHLVEKHKTTEMNLTNQAQTLKSVTDLATSDVHKLHEKIGRKKKVEEENETVSQRFRQDMLNCFHHIDETLEVRTQEVVDFHSLLEEQIKSIKDHQSKQIDAAIDHISKDLVNQEVKNSGKLLDAIDHFHNEYNSWVCARMEESSNMNQGERQALQNILDQVSSKHREFFESNMKISDNLKLLCADTSSKLISLTDSARKFFNEFCNSLLVDRNTLTQQMKNIKKSVEMVVENHDQNMHDDESISALFDDFRKQMDEMQKKYDGYKAKKKERDSLMSTELSEVHTISNKITEETSANYGKNVQKEKMIEDFIDEHVTMIRKEVSSTLEENWKKANDANIDSDNAFKKLEIDLNARKSALRSFNNNFQATATKLQPIAEKEKEGINAIVQDMHKIVTEVSAAHSHAAEDRRSHLQDGCCDLNKKLEHLTTESLSHKKDLTSQLQSMHVKVERFVEEELQRDKPTGDTPVRRDFIYPRHLVATSPYERIIQKFRETRKVVESSDDEADNTMTEILSSNLNGKDSNGDRDSNGLSTPVRTKNNNVKSSTPYSESKSRLPVIHGNYSLIKSASTSDLPLTTKPQLDSTALSESEILKEQDNKENGENFVKPEKSRIKRLSKAKNSKKILSSHNNS